MNTDRIKAHFKKYKTAYIVGGSIAAGVIIGVVVAKRLSAKSLPELPQRLFQLGGEKSPVRLSLTDVESAAYNRVAQDIVDGGIKELPGGGYQLLLEVADNADMNVYNKIGAMVNDVIRKNGGFISEEVFDIDQPFLVEL